MSAAAAAGIHGRLLRPLCAATPAKHLPRGELLDGEGWSSIKVGIRMKSQKPDGRRDIRQLFREAQSHQIALPRSNVPLMHNVFQIQSGHVSKNLLF
jgi:hypothetical protein